MLNNISQYLYMFSMIDSMNNCKLETELIDKQLLRCPDVQCLNLFLIIYQFKK